MVAVSGEEAAGALCTVSPFSGRSPDRRPWPLSPGPGFGDNWQMTTPSRHLIGNRVASAKSTTDKVQEDIHLAEAELHLANRVITDKLSKSVSDADLKKAVTHNEQVEEKLHGAGEDLKLVSDLLSSEERDRKRLEQELQDYQQAEGTTEAGSRTGAGSASVIEHLRALTRHKPNPDPAEPA
jgi:chromosome segregation ATPase